MEPLSHDCSQTAVDLHYYWSFSLGRKGRHCRSLSSPEPTLTCRRSSINLLNVLNLGLTCEHQLSLFWSLPGPRLCCGRDPLEGWQGLVFMLRALYGSGELSFAKQPSFFFFASVFLAMEEESRRKWDVGVWYSNGHWPDRKQVVLGPLGRPRKGGGGWGAVNEDRSTYVFEHHPLCIHYHFFWGFIFFFFWRKILKVYNLCSLLPPSVPLFRLVDYFTNLCGLQVS